MMDQIDPRINSPALSPTNPEDPTRRRILSILALALLGIVAYLGAKVVRHVYSYIKK